MQQKRTGREERSSLPPVYVDTLLDDPETLQSGYERYRPLSTTLGVFRYPHSLLTAVGNGRKTEQVSTLTLRLSGEFQQFQATIGRDDAEAAGGPGYAYYEVRGDDRLLFKSLALRSPRTMVAISPGAGMKARSVPQEIDLSVRGVSTLTLLTRYASDLTQQAPQVGRARGCVWGDARLLPLPASVASTFALRDTLRIASLKLSGAVVNPSGDDSARKFPLILALPPLRIIRSEQRLPFAETALRELLQDFLQAARRGGEPVLVLVKGREQNRLVSSLPSTRGEGLENMLAAARRAGAQMMIAGTLLPPERDERLWHLDLLLADCASGATIASVVSTLPAGNSK